MEDKPLEIDVFVAYRATDGIISAASLALITDRAELPHLGRYGRTVDRVLTSTPIHLGMRRSDIVEVPRPPANPDEDRIYPCLACGKLRTRAEGGTVFSVCEACWNKRQGKLYDAYPAWAARHG